MEWVFPFFRGSPGSKEVCALCSTCSDFLGPVPSMCWQSPDSLSYHVGMGTVDRGFFKVAAGSGHLGVPKESDSPRERPTCKGDRFLFSVFHYEEAVKAQVVLKMSAANRQFEYDQDVCIYSKNVKADGK